MKEINLEEIFFNEFEKSKDDQFTIPLIISAMREACKQTLELAAEKVSDSSLDLEYNSDNNKFQDEILELINQIK